MADLEKEKKAAAAAAVADVQQGMLVGLGTGSTTAYAVKELGRRVVEEGLRVEGTATSVATENLARQVGIVMRPFENLSAVDLAIDGADELDPYLQAIKGGGGALLREKIIDSAAKRLLVVVDSSKPVAILGRFKLPLEVLPFAAAWIDRVVSDLGGTTTHRRKPDGSAFLTDQKNYIFDADFGFITTPTDLALRLAQIPGLLEHGLFIDLIDTAYIAREGRVDVIQRLVVNKERHHGS